jgi:PAS domain-containing protein
MDVARWLLPVIVLGPFLVGAVAVAWVLAARLRRINAEIEERVRARTSELAASERQHRRLIEDFAEGIIIHRLGLIRFVNAAALRLFGSTDPAEVLGRPVLDLIAPEHRETVATRVDARLGSRRRRRSSWKPSGETGAASGSG